MLHFQEFGRFFAIFIVQQRCCNEPRKLIMSIADIFAAQLEELKQRDIESQRRTQALIERSRRLIEELEAIDLDSEV